MNGQNVYILIINPSTGDTVELPYMSVSYIEELNNGYSATLNFDYIAVKEICDKYSLTPVQLFTSSFREVKVIRSDGSLLWRGVISDYTRSVDAYGKYSLTVACVDYFALLQKRRTALTRIFTNTDPATIAWNLINDTQTSESPYSDFGITQGTANTTGLSQSITYQFAEIRQEIINLSNANQANSFDFDIDYTLKFNTYFPIKGSVRNNIVLDQNNIIANTVDVPVVLNLTNEVYVIGNGVNSDVTYVNRQATNSYKISYKKLEDVLRDSQQTDTNILNNIGDKFIVLKREPLSAISVTHLDGDPDVTTYGIGDTIIVNIPEEQISYAQYRVKKRTVDIDDKGTIKVQIDLLTI